MNFKVKSIYSVGLLLAFCSPCFASVCESLYGNEAEFVGTIDPFKISRKSCFLAEDAMSGKCDQSTSAESKSECFKIQELYQQRNETTF